MKTKNLINLMLLLTMMFFTVKARADVLPSSYYSKVGTGTFYLYNVAHGQFLVRLSNNFPGLSNGPAEVTLSKCGGGYTVRFSDGKYLKTGFWNNQYLWTDGVASATEAVWSFEPVEEMDNVYLLKRADADTWNGETGVFYANGTNAATSVTEECRWALVSPDAYFNLAVRQAIPLGYRSDIPTRTGQYYLYDMLNQTFLNTANCTLSDEPVSLVTFTPAGSSFLISGATDKYLKIGAYKGQYLWSDGDADNTRWTIEAAAGEQAEKRFYIFTKDFTDTDYEVAGKTMYLDGTNASATKPAYARWMLISEDAYVDYLRSGEGTVDAAAVAANKATMVRALGDATSLLRNPCFERSAEGWWGGERTLNQLYRGSGYAYGASDGSVLMQTVKHMPKGVYKVVAAVRGNVGTTVTACVADGFGETVVNQGTNSVKAQLNMNGVKMPYCSAGGFNTSDNSSGWDFVTAVGTLEEDGHLKLEFEIEGSGNACVTDVHLYYLSDGKQAYAVGYEDGVDAVNHAVTCDIVAENPNKLFTSNVVISTISNAKLNNNLVGGVMSNLVLCDGYDFEASADFIANKAVFYCNVPSGVVSTLCVPFAIASGADGCLYEPKSLTGDVLNLSLVGKAEAGRAYICHGSSDVTALVGGGNVKAVSVSGMLTGTYRILDEVPHGCYVVNGNMLKRVSGSTSVGAFRAYVEADSEDGKIGLNFDVVEDDGIWKKPQVALCDYAVNQELYLFNVGAARFYTEANAYGTQASVGSTGLKVKFVPNGDVVKLMNYSNVKNAWCTAFVTSCGAMYVDGGDVTECNWQIVPGADNTFKVMIAAPNATYNQTNYPGAMMGLDLFEYDLRTNLAALLFADEEPGSGLYLTNWAVCKPEAYEKYQNEVETYKTALQLKDMLDEAVANGLDVADEQAVYENSSSSIDKLMEAIVSVTGKMIEDELNGASMDNPLDLTDKFIVNPRYENNDNEGWSGTAAGIDEANNLQNAEFFNKDFDCYQDLRGLPEGFYRVSVQGFYRAGLEGPAYQSKVAGTEDEVMNVTLYASTEGQEATVKVQSIFTGARTEAMGVSGEINLGSWWVPNNMSSSAAYFAAGYYNGNSVIVHVTNGVLRIGIRKDTTIRRDWTMIDNWRLEYMGNETPEN